MHRHRTPAGLEVHTQIDRAVLDLLLDDENHRPWAEDELGRAVTLPGDIRDALRRLRASRLVHRWNDLVTASRPAVRLHQIMHPADGDPVADRQRDGALLEHLLGGSAEGDASPTEAQIYETHGDDGRQTIPDALARLDAACLIERRGGRVIPSEVARRFDELTKL